MTDQPWLRHYPGHVDAAGAVPATTVPAMFAETLAADPDAVSLRWFGRDLTRAEVGRLAGRLAAAFHGLGVGRGDRVAVSLQNTPVFVLALLAAWRLGAVVVPVNPMLRAPELAHVLADCEPRVLVCHPDVREVVDRAAGSAGVRPHVVESLPADLAGDEPGPWADTGGGSALLDLLEQAGPTPPEVEPAPDDLALLTYTSGTTGPSKGSMSSHATLVYQAVVAGDWFGLGDGDEVLTTAPFFHITGLGLHLALGLGRGLPLVLTNRFDPEMVLRLLDRHRPSFTVGAITAFIALADRAAPGDAGLVALHVAFSGGAPVAESVVQRYERDFGVYVHNIYGLTETTSACVSVPRGVRAPVDPASGALAIGVPLPGFTVTVVDDDGAPLPPGSTGELVVQGPSVASGYWGRPEETAHAFRADGLHTGDVAVIDEDGWVYLVDRKKDLLVVSGYKVWPREVEDVLYLHPAVREAAVVGRPDDYQGESVAAYVALRGGADVTADELKAHCREHLSAYKCPRDVRFLEDLPKTATGKILRRELRGR